MSIPGADRIGFILTAWGVAFVLLVVFAWAYRRGKRVLAGPSCRACGYDVSMRPADSTRCSECGADLTAPKAIQTHAYRRRWWALAPLLLALAAAFIALDATRRFQWRAYYIAFAPTSFIIHHAEASPGPGGDDMRAEWNRRAEQKPRLIEHLLRIQLPATSPRSVAAATLIERALINNELSEPDRLRYFDQLLGKLALDMPGRVRVDYPFAFTVKIPTGEGRGVFRYQYAQKIEIDGDALLTFVPPSTLASLPPEFRGRAGQAAWRDKMPFRGTHTVTVRVGVRVIGPPSSAVDSRWIERTVTVPFELVSSDEHADAKSAREPADPDGRGP